jgi:hypothetical protein
MSINSIDLKIKEYGFPNPSHPFYSLTFILEPVLKEDYHVKSVRVDGRSVRDIWIYNNGTPSPDDQWSAGKTSELVIRWDWQNDTNYVTEVDIEDQKGNISTLRQESTAPHWGGYWDKNWSYYSASVLTEHVGEPRHNEPVHLLLSFYAERMTDPQKEIRVVGIDPATGLPQEIPSQVYGVSTQTNQQDENAQPSTTMEVAFLSDVAALSSKVYLVFYGNPHAEMPVYQTDLVVSGKDFGLTIENSYYRIKLHDQSGQLDEIFLKQGVNVLFDHHIESPGPLHWNPDIYAPPRIWSHACDWDPPENYTNTSGPIFFSTKRWGILPEYPDVMCSITYTFYAYQPYMMMESVTDISEDLDVRALRNGEIVVNLNVIREFAWKHPDGKIMTMELSGRPKEPRRAVDIPASSPWWAFFNREVGCSLAAVILESNSIRRENGLSRAEPYITMKWGPWAYCVRPLAYSYNSANPQRLVRVPASSSFSEKIAFHPTRLGKTDENRFDPIETVHQKLAHPLSISEPQMEVDARVPEGWGPTFPFPWL